MFNYFSSILFFFIMTISIHAVKYQTVVIVYSNKKYVKVLERRKNTTNILTNQISKPFYGCAFYSLSKNILSTTIE